MITALIAALKDGDVIVRAAAANALGEFGEAAKEAVQALALLMRDLTTTSARQAAAGALKKIGSPAAPACRRSSPPPK